MNIIRVTVDNEVTVHKFPDGTMPEQMNSLRKMIGEKCELVEHVMPRRLYSALGASNQQTGEKGSCASILVDEDGYYHQLPVNIVGSYLYESDLHGNPILGNILIIGEMWNGDGISFCGLSDEQFNIIYPQINQLAKKAREK